MMEKTFPFRASAMRGRSGGRENQMTVPEDAVIFIERAEHAGDFTVQLNFCDGTERVVDGDGQVVFTAGLRGQRTM